MAVKKLIEVALPLEAINDASAREKSIRHGHPATLHLWWARRPLATARAVVWASLVDDPSSHPELFPTEEAQNKERERLFRVLEKLVVWENSNNSVVLSEARKEIERYNNSQLPVLLDPFAGGGAIPLEAQRLGLKTYAHDLNPVAVAINKAMIDFPARFSGSKPVNPEARRMLSTNVTYKAQGIAEDINYYGKWLRNQAFKKIGHLYPKMKISAIQGEDEVPVIAWIWARNVKCPNPACSCTTPLIRSFALSKKKGKEAYIKPVVENGKIRYEVVHGTDYPEGTVNRTGAHCIFCNQPIDFGYIRTEAKCGKMHEELVGIIGEGKHGRVFSAPYPEQVLAAKVDEPEDCPETDLPQKALGFRVQAYGMTKHKDLFTNRQLKALMTFCGLIKDVQKVIEKDAIESGFEKNNLSLEQGGTGARAYSEAISVYLSFLVDQVANHSSTICSWNAPNTQMRNTFARQAIPMVWDYAECNIFSNSSGSFNNLHDLLCKSFISLGNEPQGTAKQFDAQSDSQLRNVMVSTDPPYYDNIGYADLSDYFYIWLRLCLKDTFPSLFKTMLVPKAEELIATPFRFDGNMERAKGFFESGMYEAFRQVYKSSCSNIPVTIYYAFKQNDDIDSNEGSGSRNSSTTSSGWETMLSAIIRSGFAITGTWPMRTEKPGRSVGIGTNALSSSIVLVCRKRQESAVSTTRRNFVNELKRELRPSLKRLQSSNIAPVDLAQSAIGPGMGVYSKYSKVYEADGTPMSVRSALQIINQELDLYFNEQDSDLDSESRFCVELYSQVAFNDMKFGDANTLATAKNTSVSIIASHGVLYAQKGVVHLIERCDLPVDIDAHNSIWLLCQQLTYKMEKEGVEGCANAVSSLLGSASERAKDLAYRLFTLAERKKWAQEAYAYNALVVSWPEIQSRAAEIKAMNPEQLSIFDN